MKKQSHVPKFGNWEDDNVPYTAYFNNAHKGKGGVMINPNDPEENPEAFIFEDGSDGDVRAVPSPGQFGPSMSMSAEKYQMGGHQQQKSATPRSMISESSSEINNSDYPQLQKNNRQMKSDQKKSWRGDNKNFNPPSPGPNRPRRGYHAADDLPSYISASIPKFGAWDEVDPASGVGFTVIFNKVKEEKQIAAANLPIPPQPNIDLNSQKQKQKTRSKYAELLLSVLKYNRAI